MAAFVIATLTAFGLDYYLTASNLRVLPAANLSGSLLLFLIALAMSFFTFIRLTIPCSAIIFVLRTDTADSGDGAEEHACHRPDDPAPAPVLRQEAVS